MAFSNLWRRKLRTSLTILAVVIGATLVTLVISLSNGLERFIVDQFGLFISQESITVSTVEVSFGGGGGPREINVTEVEIPRPFTSQDVERIEAINGVERVDFAINTPALFISAEGDSRKFSVFADTGPDYEIQLRQLVAGSYFTETDSGQCLIAFDYLEAFGWPDTASALGQQVTIMVGKLNPFDTDTRQYSFSVGGVMQNTLNATEVLVPMADAVEMSRFYQDNPLLYSEAQPGFLLKVKAIDEASVETVAGEIKAQGFFTITSAEILDEINSVFGVIEIGLSAFAIIALLVAAIGIVNTLLMTIYERTREIGVMKAVGATKRAVRLMFTMEGAALGFLGGAIGGGTGWFLGQVLNIVGSRTFLSDFPNFQMSAFPPWLIFGIIGLTTVISLVAALYPANRAARLHPVDALRYE
jgi:putative ABC transport system permease protein